MHSVYLDYAASAPLAPEAKTVIAQFMARHDLGNPSSPHRYGRATQALLDQAHTTIAAVFGVHPTEVIFTSGATEANNLAIRGVLAAWRKSHTTKPHVVLTAIEHPSWYRMVETSAVDMTIVPVSRDGVVSAAAVLEAIQPNTALVGCMLVNNEIGTIQPVTEIGKRIAAKPWPVFHTDAVQAFPYLNTHSGHLHADTMTVSGHKYGALSGSGVLLLKKHTPLEPVIKGGEQEWGYRAGTENVLGALTMAEVVQWADSHRDELTKHAKTLQHILESRLRQIIPQATILGESGERAPHITYLWLPGVIDEHIVHKLDLAGVAVSSGSACSSGAMLPSATLLALGYSDKEAFGGIRISYGRFTTLADIEQFLKALPSVL